MIDVDALLQPISENAPAGRNLRLDPSDLTFVRLEELRTEVDPREDPEGRGRSPDWLALIRECQGALAKQSKDLELAALLVEGLTRVEGLPGLRVGLELVRRLIDGFWQHLHPGVEDGEIVEPVRAREIARLGSSTRFLALVKGCPLASAGARRLSWADSVAADQLQEASSVPGGSRHQELVSQGALPRAALRAAFQLAPRAEIADSLALLQACSDEARALAALCRQRFAPAHEPSLFELERLLDDVRTGVQDLSRQPEGGRDTTQGAGQPADITGAASGAIASRAVALEQLRAVAAYFRAAEPHSPIASLIERAIKWGQMPFEQVLRDVVKSEDALARVWETLGITPPDKSGPDKSSSNSGW